MAIQLAKVEKVYGEPVDDVRPERRVVDVNVHHHHDHSHRTVVDGTHANVGRIVAARYDSRLRQRDSAIAARQMRFSIIRAFADLFSFLSPLREEPSVGAGSEQAEAQAVSPDHSCTNHGDWGDYGYF